MAIFNFFGSILGYLLWFLYSIFRNYGVAILLFTIILKAVMFPMSVKQQRSMTAQSKLADKQKELQKRYANNQQKYNDELMKLYEKEGVNPGSGCLTTLLPFPIMLGIFYSVIMPLSNTLHIASETVQQATDYISRIPGVASATGLGMYSELQIIKHFEVLRPNLTMFSAADLEKIDFFSKGFRFLGLDLLSSPQGSGFLTFLWIIPVLSLVLSFGSQWYMTRSTGQTQTGCTKAMMYVFPLISVYWAFIMPAAVGMYNIISIVTSALQTLVMNKYFSADQLTAGNEARRAVTLELAEAGVRPLPVTQQKQIAEKLAAAAPQQKQDKDIQKQQKQQRKKKQGSGSGDSASYRGSKK